MSVTQANHEAEVEERLVGPFDAGDLPPTPADELERMAAIPADQIDVCDIPEPSASWWTRAKERRRRTLSQPRLIRRVDELKGTCYIEFVPGRYTGEHWSSTAVFLSEEAFLPLRDVFIRHYRGFDYYGINNIPLRSWEPIIADLLWRKDLLLSTAAVPNVEEIAQDLARWVVRQLDNYNHVAVLGM